MSKKIFISIFLYFFCIIPFLKSQVIRETNKVLPDLTIKYIWKWPKHPTSREWFDIKVRVYNNSTVAMKKPTSIQLFIGGSTKPYVFRLSYLPAKSSRDFVQQVLIKIPGNYIARAVIDPEKKISELNEDNNSKQMHFSIRNAKNSQYLPDIYIYKPSYTPKKPCVGDNIKFVVAMINNGVVSSPNFKTAIMVGGSAPVLLHVPPILHGETKKVSLSMMLHRAGDYIVTSIADYGNKVKEYDEKNNQSSKNFTVYDKCCPDLVVSHNYIWIWPHNPKTGEEFALRIRVFNKGLKSLPRSTELKVYVGGSLIPYVFNIGLMHPSSDITFEKKLSFNRAGKYKVRVVVDPLNKIRECKKNNNADHIEFRIR